MEAQNVVRIRSSHWREIAEKEAKRTPSIARLQPDDTIHSISLKLTDENIASADDTYSKSSKHYEADVAAVAGVNASILKFLLTRIEGIEATSAVPFIKLLQWDKVLDAVRTSYGSIQSPKACNDLNSELGKIMLGDDETVTQFIHRTRNLVANIQIIINDLRRSLRRQPLHRREVATTLPQQCAIFWPSWTPSQDDRRDY